MCRIAAVAACRHTASRSGNSSSSSGSIGVSVGQQTGITVSASKGRGNQAGDDLTHTNTHIAAGNSVTLQSGGDTDLKGAVVSGKQVVADVGGDLKLESLQDSSSYASRNQSAGGSLTISPAGVPIGGGLNAGQSKVDVYTPTSTNPTSIARAIEGKNRQATAVIVQTSIADADMATVAARTWGKPTARNIQTIFFQKSDGSIIRFNRPTGS